MSKEVPYSCQPDCTIEPRAALCMAFDAMRDPRSEVPRGAQSRLWYAVAPNQLLRHISSTYHTHCRSNLEFKYAAESSVYRRDALWSCYVFLLVVQLLRNLLSQQVAKLVDIS